MASKLPSGQGLSRKDYLRKLRGGRGLYGAGSAEVKNIRSTYYGSAPKPATPASPPSGSSAPPLPGSAEAAGPWNLRYEGTVGQINTSLLNTETDINAAEARTRRDFGFDDLTNPYSRARLLEDTYQQNKRSSAISMGRHLYSGSFQNAQDATLQNFQQGQHQLRTEYDDTISDLIRRRVAAKNEAAAGIGSAEAQRLEDALNQEPSDPGAPAPAKAPAKADLGPKGKKYKNSGPPPGSNWRWNNPAQKWVKA